MVDIAAIAGIMSSLNALTNISKAMIDIRDGAALQTKAIELQGIILSAQQSAMSAQTEYFAMLERVRGLEKEIDGLNSWEAEKARYELVQIASDVVAYRIRPGLSTSEPSHLLCGNCFNQGRKSFLQKKISGPSFDQFKCHSCGEELNHSKSDPSYRSDYRHFEDD